MGTCVSKCYPCFPCHPIACNNSISTAGISQASPAVHPHPHPLPGEAGAASASPTTSSSSVSLLASTSLCASSSGSSSSSSAAPSSSYLWPPRPRELVLLPNAAATSSMLSREWDVVVLDPKSKSSDSDRCKPIISGRGHGSDRHRLATPTPKRARSVSPLSARPAPPPPPGSYEKQQQQQQHKKRRQNTGRRSTTATQREVVALAQARNNEHKKKKTEVSQSLRRLDAKISSSAHADSTTAAALARVTAEDDLTNPVISMDCFIFL